MAVAAGVIVDFVDDGAGVDGVDDIDGADDIDGDGVDAAVDSLSRWVVVVLVENEEMAPPLERPTPYQ